MPISALCYSMYFLSDIGNSHYRPPLEQLAVWAQANTGCRSMLNAAFIQSWVNREVTNNTAPDPTVKNAARAARVSKR